MKSNEPKSGGSAGKDINNSKQALGGKIVTTRGYKGGSEMSELIGAKKIEGPKA
jgi:hypothetical protein